MALTDVVSSLPLTSQLIVAILAIIAVAIISVVVAQADVADTRWVVAATVGGFFLVDLLYIHPEVFDNVPALFYWVAKPIWAGVPMFAAAWYLKAHTDVNDLVAYALAGVAGIVVLQLYYTVVPIPVVGGESIQVGLVGNLTVGVPVHGAGLLAALAVVVAGMMVTGEG